MTAEELKNIYLSRSHPNDIFKVHEEFQKLQPAEKEKFRRMFGRDEVGMQYITAVEMKKNGTWEDYIAKWEENKGKTGEEWLKKYMDERGLEFPG